MTAPAPAVSHWPRVLSREDASALNGQWAPALEPNVTTPVVVADASTGAPAFAYLPLGDVAPLRRLVLDVPFRSNKRASGWANMSINFGYSPRRPIYGREGCERTYVSQSPTKHAVLQHYANLVRDRLHEIFPDVAARDRDTMAHSGVMAEWKLGETNWTSGVINKASALPYHRDAFNFPVWTAMPVLRRHMDGGYLHIPEYDAVVASRDGWAVFFPGYELVHAVTPMTPTRPDGYRYSVVYYALKGMKDCFTHAIEQDYALKRRTEREQDLARKLAATLEEDQ